MVQHVLLPEKIPELGCSASFSCSPLEQLFAQHVNPSEQIPALHPEGCWECDITALCLSVPHPLTLLWKALALGARVSLHKAEQLQLISMWFSLQH